MNMIFSIRLLSLTSAFVTLNVGRINAFSVGKVKLIPYRKPQSKLHLSSNKQIAAGDGAKKLVHLEVIATTGLTSQEVPIVLPQIISSVGDNFGMEVITGEDSKHGIIHLHINPVSESVPGATGRVILLSLNNVANDWTEDDERLEPFKNVISQQIDSLVGFRIEQPILVSVVPNFDHKATRKESLIIDSVRQIIKNEVSLYDLCTPIGSSHCAERKREEIVPVTHIEIDGAHITDHFSGEEVWDTSSILVFDDFVDHSLRERLLDVVNKRSKEYDWDDKNNGPDTSRWTKGGLVDIFNESETTSTSWGLTEDATHDLCFNHHDAISEVEEKISEYFHEFIVSRLPEAVLGSCVSPLTANAPTFGDSFSYHIDADPNQTPPCKYMYKLLTFCYCCYCCYCCCDVKKVAHTN